MRGNIKTKKKREEPNHYYLCEFEPVNKRKVKINMEKGLCCICEKYYNKTCPLNEEGA